MNEEIYQGLFSQAQDSEPISYDLNVGRVGAADFQRAMEEANSFREGDSEPRRVSPRTVAQNIAIHNAEGNSHTEITSIDITSLPQGFTERDVMQQYINSGINLTRTNKINSHKKFLEKREEKKEISNLEFLNNLV
jgi:hypothetical protein